MEEEDEPDLERAASQYYGCPDPTGLNAVVWSQLTAREARKCSPACASEEKAMGFGERIADYDTEVQVSLLSPYPELLLSTLRGTCFSNLKTIGLEV